MAKSNEDLIYLLQLLSSSKGIKFIEAKKANTTADVYFISKQIFWKVFKIKSFCNLFLRHRYSEEFVIVVLNFTCKMFVKNTAINKTFTTVVKTFI